jgi:glutamine phosphoribosylpyrophosphate amidotransferase
MVIGFTPDDTRFMVHDAKKLRPGAVGGIKGKMALASEKCGVETIVLRKETVRWTSFP